MNCLKRFCFFIISIGISLFMYAQMPKYSLHTVAKGETIYSISSHYQVTIQELVGLNPGCDKVIRIGETLKIPTASQSAGVATRQPVRSEVTYHTIQPKETLYQLSRRYNVTAEAICRLNPGLTADNFQAGKAVAIPPYTGEVEPEKTIITTKTDRPANETNPCRDMHKIKRKETIYGICKAYGITETELRAANPELNDNDGKLKKGHYLCIPYHVEKVVQKVEPTNEELIKNNRPQTTFYKKLKVGLVLPFSSNERAKHYSAKLYYNGFLMAVDSLKSLGVNLDITIYDSGKKEEKIDSLCRLPRMKEMHILFCPQLELHEGKMAEFAKKNHIRLVLTRSDDAPANPYLFVTNPSNNMMYADVCDHFIRSFRLAHVVILDMQDTNARTRRGDFTKELKNVLGENGITYKYLTIQSSEEQIAEALSTTKQNVVVVNSAGLALMKKLLPVWQKFAENHPQYKISFFGHQEWLHEANDMKNTFYALDVHLYSKWWFNPNNAASKQLAAGYHKWFGSKLPTVMPSVPTIGFDTTFYLLQGLSTYGSDFELNLKQMAVKPYQNFIEFERVNNWGGFVNRKIAFIHFNKKVVSIDF